VIEKIMKMEFIPVEQETKQKLELFPISVDGKKFIGSGEDAMPYAGQTFLEWSAECEPR
jgi:hypothetical protein